MAVYCVRADLDNEFGIDNIDSWADSNNDADPDVIEDRVTWAIRKATAHINAELLGNVYSTPFDDIDDVPDQLQLMCATYAGIFLYRSPRGMPDGADASGNMATLKDETDLVLQRIKAGTMKLPLTPLNSYQPDAIPESEQATS